MAQGEAEKTDFRPISAEHPLWVTGADGRIGRLLRLTWADRAVRWLDRAAWDIGSTEPPFAPGARVLHLAGTTTGDLGANALAARGLAASGAQVVLISSIAVYGASDLPLTEDSPTALASPYGRAKLEVEEILAPLAPCILRLGNLFGADALTRAATAGAVTLDRAGPAGPWRSWIGPLTLARVLWDLAQAPRPGIWNLAQPPALAMGDILTALGVAWRLGPDPAPWPRAEMEVSRLSLPPATPEGLVAEWASLRVRWP